MCFCFPESLFCVSDWSVLKFFTITYAKDPHLSYVEDPPWGNFLVTSSLWPLMEVSVWNLDDCTEKAELWEAALLLCASLGNGHRAQAFSRKQCLLVPAQAQGICIQRLSLECSWVIALYTLC